MKRFFFLIVSAVLLLTACNKQTDVLVQGVKFVSSSQTLYVGESIMLDVVIVPSNAVNKSLQWGTNNANIVSVSQSGEIRAIAPGKATVSVITEDGAFKDVCEITVLPITYAVSGIEWTEEYGGGTSATLQLTKGSKTQLAVTVLPENATDKTVLWNSSDNTVLAVDQSGNVDAISTGQATIVATTEDGGFTATCEITVTENAGGLSLNPKSLELKEFEQATLAATITPEDATDKTVIWKSSDETVAVVAFGMVTAKKAGECTITASTSNGEFSDACAVTVTCPVQGIDLDEHSATLKKGATFQLNAIVSPDRATNKAVRWESSDEDVATVDDNGTVTGVNVCEEAVMITAISVDNESVYSSCKVKVVSPVSSISIEPEQIDIYENDSQQLELTFDPGDASNKEVNWTCRDTDIATVDDKGNVKGIKAGKTEVYAASKDGGNMAFCRVSVYSHVKSIDLYFKGTKIDDGSEIKAFKGEIVEVEAVLQPKETILNKDVTWNNGNTKVLRDKGEGKFEAISSGEAVLTVTAADGGIKASCKVVVTNPAREISLNETQVNLTKGSTAILTATVIPADADDKRVEWSSSDNTVATVDQSGKVVAVKSGTADIIVKSVAVPSVSKSCQVKVTTPVESVKLEPEEVKITVSETRKLTATVLPADADNKTLKWTSSNSLIVSVNDNGEITGLKAGSATITAASAENPEKKASCTVVVSASKKLVTSVTLSETSKQLTKGKTLQLTATVKPDDATDKTLTWVSDNTGVATVTGAGLVKAVAVGSATIKATANDGSGKYATCKITVVSSQTKVPVQSVTIYCDGKETKSLTIHPGESRELEAVVSPEDATNKEIKWDHNMISGQADLEINGNRCKVTAMGYSSFTLNLYAISKDNESIKKYCKIDIVPVPLTKLDLNLTKKAARVGEKFELYPVYTPENVSKKIVTWKVGDGSVVSIDSNTGIVTCLKEGETKVTATWLSGSTRFDATCDVKVLPKDNPGGGVDNFDFEFWN